MKPALILTTFITALILAHTAVKAANIVIYETSPAFVAAKKQP